MRPLALLSFFLFPFCSHPASRVAHVIVALCDNVNQGIVPVPAALGNGQDADRNLYWGAGFGVRTWFDRKSGNWTRVSRSERPSAHLIERIVWKHRTEDLYLIADAYDGAFIEEAINTALAFAAGHQASEIRIADLRLSIGGGADLIAYCGHDGLMEFAPAPIQAPVAKAKPLIVLACISKRYFAAAVRSTTAEPLLWTTGLMAPEAYTLDAALQAWATTGKASTVREHAAAAYAKWQKCSLGAARKLLVSGW